MCYIISFQMIDLRQKHYKADLTEYLYSILRNLISNRLAELYNLNGTMDKESNKFVKLPFRNLRLTKIVLGVYK